MGATSISAYEKSPRIGKDPHPLIVAHQDRFYGGVAWANELARRGYVVVVPDAFTFGSRRVRAADVSDAVRNNLEEKDAEAPDEIARYNALGRQSRERVFEKFILRRSHVAGSLCG